jgi:hypothetical protein
MKTIGRLVTGPITPFRTKEEEAAEQYRLLMEDKGLDILRGLPWVRRMAYMSLYVTQLAREIDSNPRIEPEQRQRMLSHIKRIDGLIQTASSKSK